MQYKEEMSKAIDFYQKGNYLEALNILDKLIISYPDQPEIYFALAKIKSDVYGRQEEAIELYLKAIDILPSYDSYRELALIYFAKNDKINSKKYAKLALIYNSGSQQMIDLLKNFPEERNYVKEYDFEIKDEYEHSIDCKQLKYKKVYDPETIKRNSPKIISELLTNNQRLLFEKAVKSNEINYEPEGFVIKIPDGRAILQQGYQTQIITADGKLLKDLFLYGCPSLPEQTYHNEVRVADKLLVLSTCWSGNYYHWLTWVFPRLKMLKLAGYKLKDFDKIAINNIGFKYQRELLSLLGIPKSKIIATPNNCTVLRAKILVTTSLPSHFATPRIVAESLRESLLVPKCIDESMPKRIYLSRNKSVSRHILNEDEVVKYLSQYGFSVIYAEDLTVAEQVKYFANAEFIISQHGAGLTNLFFCKPKTKVVEIYNEHFSNQIETYFFRACSSVDLDHCFMFGEPDSSSDNMTIDLSKLSKTMELAGLSENLVTKV